MPTPSLLIVPARFKTGRLYSQIPTSGAGDFTVTRNTAARRFDSAGLVASVASGIPRLDYFTSGGVTGCPALLVEPAGTNICLQSEDFSTTWVAQNSATVNTNTAISPDGTQNADTINLAAISDSRVRQLITVANSTTYTISCFYKNIALTAGQTFRMRYNNSLSAPNNFIAAAVIDLAAGTATYSLAGTSGTGFSGTATGRIENYGNGWYRVSVSFTVGTAGAATGIFEAASVDTVPAVRSFYAWGAQVETGSVATSYIPTTTGTGSRSADVISVSGAVSGSIGQTEGTIYWEGAIYRFDRVFFALSSGTSTTQAVRLQTTGAGLLQGIAISGTVQGNPQTSGAVTLGQFYKVAFAYKENDFVLYVNGVFQASDTSGTLPTNLNSVYFCNSNGTEITDQRCRAAALYTTRLTNAELAALTA